MGILCTIFTTFYKSEIVSKRNVKIRKSIHCSMCNDSRKYIFKISTYTCENNLVKRLSEKDSLRRVKVHWFWKKNFLIL